MVSKRRLHMVVGAHARRHRSGSRRRPRQPPRAGGASRSAGCRAAIPIRRTSAPASAAWAASVNELHSWIWPGPSGLTGRDQLVAGRDHGDPRPAVYHDRGIDRWRRAVRSRPGPGPGRARAAASPAATSYRGGGHGRAEPDGARSRRPSGTSDAPAGASVSSTGTTVSAPAGIIAPVMIRSPVPPVTSSSGARPAAISPRTRSTTGGRPEAAATSPPGPRSRPSRCWPGRQRQGGGGRARQGKACGIGEVDVHGREGGDAVEDVGGWASSSGIRSGRSGIEALRAKGRPPGGCGPGRSGYAAREAHPASPAEEVAGGPARRSSPIERWRTRGDCPSDQRGER